MRLAYVRVSTIEQNEQRQTEVLKSYEIDKWFIEKASAKDTNRPILKELLAYARPGDTIYIKDFSRISRSTRDLLDLLEELEQKQITLVSINESLDTSTPTGKLLVTMIAAINEFERNNLLERQREGIALAKQKGIYKGRQKIKTNDQQILELLQDKDKGYITITEIAKRLNISRATLYRRIEELQEKGLYSPTN